MSEIPDSLDVKAIEHLAAETGVAAAIVDASSREIFVTNNNSICRNLNPSGEFSPDCSRFCGKALENAARAGGTIGYECHAGLECRAVMIKSTKAPAVAIIGRTFVKSDKYRAATQRAISGDWNVYPPSEFFQNILLTGSEAVLDKTADRITDLLGEAERPQSKSSRAEKKSREQITRIIERLNRGIAGGAPGRADKPEETGKIKAQSERRTAEAQAWRSFFGSLLKIDYAKAADSILEFLAHHYGFSALMWLEKKNGRLEKTAAFGALKGRRLRLGIASNDERLIKAAQNGLSLELGERAHDPAAANNRTMSLFPIGVGGDIAAAIAILDPIEDDDVKQQIARIGHSIAPQLEILRLRSEVARASTLAAAVRKFSESLKRIDADDLWVNLTQNAAEMLRSERASLLIFNEKAGTLEIKALIGAKGGPSPGEEVGARVARIVFEKKEPVAVSDVSKTGLPPAPPERAYKTPSFLSCPIAISGRTIGVMNFADRACGLAFDTRSLELFQAIAPQLAVAIDRATLKEKAGEFEQLSVTDELTGLLNRRYMEARLVEEIKRSGRDGFEMSFLMLDVDSFKSYNDEFGHPAGDEALKLVAHVVRETLRGADVAARFGGEEFSILLPQTTSGEAVTIAERIRANIEQAEFPHRRVTTSIGVASCSAELCLSADLVLAADKALYQAKRGGRNRVILFEKSSDGSGN